MMRAPSNLLACALTLCGAVLAACSSVPEEPDPTWVRAEVAAESDNLLWKVLLLSLRKLDFPEGAEMDRGHMRITTGWRIELSPWKGRGYRRQAVVAAKPIGPGRWQVEARVRMQKNDALARTLDLSYADWVWMPDDAAMARILLQHVRGFLLPEFDLAPEELDPIEEYLRRSGDGGG